MLNSAPQHFDVGIYQQWVFSLPKRVRIYFMYDRKLLAKLSRCTWKVLNTYLKQAVLLDDAVPGAAIAVHTFGDFQQFNPHLHLIATDGCFSDTGTFTKSPGLEHIGGHHTNLLSFILYPGIDK
jgi:hypothetical protein